VSYYQECAIPKPEPRKRTKGRKLRAKQKNTREVRPYVFARERNLCRVTRFLPAESMHELRPKSLGGRVSRRNSVAVEGDGVRGVHGFLQRREISYRFEDEQRGAEGTIFFLVKTHAAAEYCRVKVGQEIISPVMVETEIEP
jgi:hypothetical protein